jgi:hypothetical protein
MRHLPDFSSAVLTGIDEAGYPFSVRCEPEPIVENKVIGVQIPEDEAIQAGPASLLFHKHDEQMWNIKSFLVRGNIKMENQGWMFHPERYTSGLGIGGLISMIQLVRTGRRTAKHYLKKRSLTCPEVRWDEIRALYTE